MEKLTDSELRTLEQSSGDDCDMTLVEMAVAEIRALRAAALTAEEHEALVSLRFLLGKHSHEPYAYGEDVELALAVLDRLLGDGK